MRPPMTFCVMARHEQFLALAAHEDTRIGVHDAPFQLDWFLDPMSSLQSPRRSLKRSRNAW